MQLLSGNHGFDDLNPSFDPALNLSDIAVLQQSQSVVRELLTGNR